jgi:hypothetical protein
LLKSYFSVQNQCQEFPEIETIVHYFKVKVYSQNKSMFSLETIQSDGKRCVTEMKNDTILSTIVTFTFKRSHKLIAQYTFCIIFNNLLKKVKDISC